MKSTAPLFFGIDEDPSFVKSFFRASYKQFDTVKLCRYAICRYVDVGHVSSKKERS